MKIKEEIEQLAEQDFNDRQECGHYELADLKSIDYYYDGFFYGYTQCQEDMTRKEIQPEDIWNDEKLNMVKKHILNHIKNQTPANISETELFAKKYAEEDMVDKKYTQEDLENAFNSGRGYGVPDNIKDFNSFINSLRRC